jgi:hypothetical protein
MPTATANTVEFVSIPAGTEAVLGVYVNGVELHEGTDFEADDDRIHFLTPVQRFRPITGFRVVLNALCIGLYNRGDTIDLRIQRDGHPEVVRADTPPARAS